MKSKKNYWYVIVIDRFGKAKFVTSINNQCKYASWADDNKPMEFTRSGAEDLVFGLRVNGFEAFSVCHPMKIDEQITPIMVEIERG